MEEGPRMARMKTRMTRISTTIIITEVEGDLNALNSEGLLYILINCNNKRPFLLIEHNDYFSGLTSTVINYLSAIFSCEEEIAEVE